MDIFAELERAKADILTVRAEVADLRATHRELEAFVARIMIGMPAATRAKISKGRPRAQRGTSRAVMQQIESIRADVMGAVERLEAEGQRRIYSADVGAQFVPIGSKASKSFLLRVAHILSNHPDFTSGVLNGRTYFTRRSK